MTLYTPDYDLINRARKRLDGGCTFRDALESALWAYQIACRLARGADPSRSRRWSEIAFDRRYDLLKAYQRAHPHEPIAEGRR